MDPAMIRRHLELAERHVAEGKQHIGRQRETVARLEQRSPDSLTLRTACELLQAMDSAQNLHIAEVNRLRELLGLAEA